MSIAILFHLLRAQHVSDINISIFGSLWLCWWITTYYHILMSETCWAHNKRNKIASDIKLVFHSSTIAMMHGPISIRCTHFIICDVIFQNLSLPHGSRAVTTVDVSGCTTDINNSGSGLSTLLTGCFGQGVICVAQGCGETSEVHIPTSMRWYLNVMVCLIQACEC